MDTVACVSTSTVVEEDQAAKQPFYFKLYYNGKLVVEGGSEHQFFKIAWRIRQVVPRGCFFFFFFHGQL